MPCKRMSITPPVWGSHPYPPPPPSPPTKAHDCYGPLEGANEPNNESTYLPSPHEKTVVERTATVHIHPGPIAGPSNNHSESPAPAHECIVGGYTH